MRTLLVASMLAAPISLGCSPNIEVEDDEGGKVTVTPDGQKVVVEGKDGKTTIQGGLSAPLPENFPADVPVYPNKQILSSHSGAPDKRLVAAVQMLTPDDPQQVADFYSEGMKDQGWTKGATTNTAQIRNTTWTKGDRQVNISVIQHQGNPQFKASLTISIEDKSKSR